MLLKLCCRLEHWRSCLLNLQKKIPCFKIFLSSNSARINLYLPDVIGLEMRLLFIALRTESPSIFSDQFPNREPVTQLLSIGLWRIENALYKCITITITIPDWSRNIKGGSARRVSLYRSVLVFWALMTHQKYHWVNLRYVSFHSSRGQFKLTIIPWSCQEGGVHSGHVSL